MRLFKIEYTVMGKNQSDIISSASDVDAVDNLRKRHAMYSTIGKIDPVRVKSVVEYDTAVNTQPEITGVMQ